MAIHTQILPPTTGCAQPHGELAQSSPALRVLREPELWPADRPLHASVSAMGFGGINVHLALAEASVERRQAFASHELALMTSVQDAELFLLGAATPSALLAQIEQIQGYAHRLSRAEMTDLAVGLEKRLECGPHRAAWRSCIHLAKVGGSLD